MTKLLAAPVAVLLVISAAGCKVGYFHAQTTWHEDGSVDRAILQPDAPPGEGSIGKWDKTFVTKERNFDFRGDIRKLTPQKTGEYFVAISKFDSWDQVPDHYRKEASDSDASSVFSRSASRRDYGLVVEYAWQEVLTEVVTLGDARNAIVEATELGGDAAAGIVAEALGDGYDTSKLNAWIVGEGRECLLELFDVFYELALKRETDDQNVRQAVAEVFQKHGLRVTLNPDVEKEDAAEFIRFLTKLFSETIRMANGDEMDVKTAETLAGAIGGLNEPRHEKIKNRLEQASKEFKQAWPGGPDDLESKTNRLVTRVFGVHGCIFDSPESFRFQMNVPGEIVETNGHIHSGGRVQWKFDGSDAWPSGYSMTVRSLARKKAGVSLLAGPGFKSTRQNLNRIVEIVGDDEALQKVLQNCREECSTTPLKMFFAELSLEDESRDRILKLLRFLKSTMKLGE